MATTTQDSSAAPAVATGANGPLTTSHGRTTIADTVVSKIAGLAAREVNGVHDLGGNTSRAGHMFSQMSMRQRAKPESERCMTALMPSPPQRAIRKERSVRHSSASV